MIVNMPLTDERIIAGIDIGTSKICTIIGQANEVCDPINIIGVSLTPSRGIKKGQVVDIVAASNAVAEGLEAAQRMAGYTMTSAYVSVGGPHIVSANSHAVVAVSRPEVEISADDVMRVSESAKALSLPSSREIVHVIPRSFVVDGQEGIRDPLGMTGSRLEIHTHIIHGAVISLRNLTRCMHDIKLDVDSFVFSGLASGFAVLTDTEKELGVAVVDIGGGTTDICLYVDGALSYSSVLPLGAKHITNDIAIGLRVNLDAAEQIKLLLGKERPVSYLDPSGRLLDKETRKKIDEIDISSLHLGDDLQSVSRKLLMDGIIRPRLEELLAHVEMEFKRSGYSESVPAGVVLCGGGALSPLVVETARRSLGLPVRVGLPQRITGLIDEVQNPVYATAVGLLLYGAQQEEDISVRQQGLSPLSSIKNGGAFVQQIMQWIKGFLP